MALQDKYMGLLLRDLGSKLQSAQRSKRQAIIVVRVSPDGTECSMSKSKVLYPVLRVP